MLELLHDDVLAFEHFESDHLEDQGGLAHKTTVGIMERDCVVINVLIGSPAEELMQVLVRGCIFLRRAMIHLLSQLTRMFVCAERGPDCHCGRPGEQEIGKTARPLVNVSECASDEGGPLQQFRM